MPHIIDDAVYIGGDHLSHRNDAEVVQRIRQRFPVGAIERGLDDPLRRVAGEPGGAAEPRAAIDAAGIERSRRQIEAGRFVYEPQRCPLPRVRA